MQNQDFIQMGNTFKLSPSFPQSLILSTSKLKSLIQEVKKDALDMDTAGLESLLSLNEDEATLTILRFAKRKDRPIVSKYHLLSGLIIVSQGSVEEKIACIFKLFDMSDLNEYTHDEFGVAVMVRPSFSSFSLREKKNNLLLVTRKKKQHVHIYRPPSQVQRISVTYCWTPKKYKHISTN